MGIYKGIAGHRLQYFLKINCKKKLLVKWVYQNVRLITNYNGLRTKTLGQRTSQHGIRKPLQCFHFT